MIEINLLDTYPRIKRPVEELSRSVEENKLISKQFGYDYFDGDRKYGYGGYIYDGRWASVAKRMRDYYSLTKWDYILDIGCAKGFLIHDFMMGSPELIVAGVDVSQYAIDNAMDDVKEFCEVADARDLPFPDKSFVLVISINTIHNLDLDGCKKAVEEMMRVSRKHMYLQVDSWFNEEQREKLMRWQLTAVTLLGVEDWRKLLGEWGYRGEFYWTITE